MGFSYLPWNKADAHSTGGNGTYLVLLRVGFTKLFRSLGILVSSYLAFSPLPVEAGASQLGVKLSELRVINS